MRVLSFSRLALAFMSVFSVVTTAQECRVCTANSCLRAVYTEGALVGPSSDCSMFFGPTFTPVTTVTATMTTQLLGLVLDRTTVTDTISLVSTSIDSITSTTTSTEIDTFSTTVATTVTTAIAQPTCGPLGFVGGYCSCRYDVACGSKASFTSTLQQVTVEDRRACLLVCDNDASCSAASYQMSTGMCITSAEGDATSQPDPDYIFFTFDNSRLCLETDQCVSSDDGGEITLRRDLLRRANMVPGYAASCTDTAQYSSACSCIGVTAPATAPTSTATAYFQVTLGASTVTNTASTSITNYESTLTISELSSSTTLTTTSVTFSTTTTSTSSTAAPRPTCLAETNIAGGGACGCTFNVACETQGNFRAIYDQLPFDTPDLCKEYCDYLTDCVAATYQLSTGICTVSTAADADRNVDNIDFVLISKNVAGCNSPDNFLCTTPNGGGGAT